jgi:hypothetical protein
MTARDMIKEWLIANKFDGLYTYGCGCPLDDLAPCENDGFDCMPGVRQRHTEKYSGDSGECDGVDCQCIGPVSATPPQGQPQGEAK